MTHTEAADGLLRVIAVDELPYGKFARKFKGYRYGDVDVSFFLVDTPPGTSPVLHTHPYEEIFVMLEGVADREGGVATIEATAGQILVAPAGVPHTFVNPGSGPLRQVDIHPSDRVLQTDIPEDGTI
jgi:mannose-6-phosphate isomerase-like protein (cupin superfamily)